MRKILVIFIFTLLIISCVNPTREADNSWVTEDLKNYINRLEKALEENLSLLDEKSSNDETVFSTRFPYSEMKIETLSQEIYMYSQRLKKISLKYDSKYKDMIDNFKGISNISKK